MAQNYDPQRDGINSLQGRKVYHVVQQVAHVKPVEQHQPIFYGRKICSAIIFRVENTIIEIL